MSENEAEVEQQREKVRGLWQKKRFDAATDLAATLSDAVLMLTPTEDIADHIRGRRATEALRLYEIAAKFWRFEGTQATGSGEGLMAMDKLARVEEKMRRLRQTVG